MLRRLFHHFRQSKILKIFAERAKRRRDREAIAASNLFDRDWYLNQNPDVRATRLDPIEHYLRSASSDGRNPNPLFDRTWYLAQYPDVRSAGLDPLVHYVRYGGFEGRDPNPLFDSDWYLAQYPDVRSAGLDPLVHYVRYGGFEGRDPNPLFDSDWYLAQNPEVGAARINPLEHYVLYGAAKGLAPNRLFKSRWYVEQHPDACATGLNPLAHYLANAQTKGVDPNPWFDSSWYLLTNPEVAAAGLNPLAHYLLEGAAQGKAPSPLFKGEWYLENVPDLEPISDRLSFQFKTTQISATPLRSSDKVLVDIVADFFGGTAEAIATLQSDPGASLNIGRVARVASDEASAVVFATAIAAAKFEKRHLLVLLGDISITTDHVAGLAGALGADPLIGYAIPRLQDIGGGVLPLLPSSEAGALPAYDQGVLRDLPALQIAPEFLSTCVLIRSDLLCNFPNIAEHFRTMAGALRALMTWGRRLGFRALIANHIVIPGKGSTRPTLPDDEQKKLIRLFPDSILADTRFSELACHYREALLARVRSPTTSERRQLLFDCSGMTAVHNGTNECILGVLEGAASIASDWNVTVYAPTNAISFHRLPERYKTFTILDGELTGTYSVAVKLSQPWSVRSIMQLHRHALRLAFLMLDTIAWDVIYVAGPEVESTWALAATHADAILHISQFTKDRFNFRFPVAPHVRQIVTYLSCHYDEYTNASPKRSPDSGHILVIGNDYEHKSLAPVLALLPRAFPQQEFVVIGQDNLRQANVTTIRSGKIPVAEMERLFAMARMLVFPSFYEGFGFPVVKGLAYGLDVVARRSALLSEIGAQCAPRGRLVPFDSDASLIAITEKIIAGQAVETIALGAAIARGGEALRWRDVAGRILGFADALVADTSIGIHDNREAALRFALPSERS
jgi:hypothetical protein